MKAIVNLDKDVLEYPHNYICYAVANQIKGKYIPIPEGCEKLCDAEKVIEGLKGIERLHADDELRSSIFEVINASII